MAGAVPFRPVRPAEIVAGPARAASWSARASAVRGDGELLVCGTCARGLLASPSYADLGQVRLEGRRHAPHRAGCWRAHRVAWPVRAAPGIRGRGDGPAVVEGCRLADPAPVAAGRVPGRHRLSGASSARRGAAGRLRAGRRLVRAAGSPRLPGRLRRESVAGGGRGGPPARSSASAPSSSTRSTSTTPAPPGCPPIFPRPPAIWARWTPAWPAPPPRSRSSRSPCSPVWAPAAELCDARARARWRSCSRGPTTGSCAPVGLQGDLFPARSARKCPTADS